MAQIRDWLHKHRMHPQYEYADAAEGDGWEENAGNGFRRQKPPRVSMDELRGMVGKRVADVREEYDYGTVVISFTDGSQLCYYHVEPDSGLYVTDPRG